MLKSIPAFVLSQVDLKTVTGELCRSTLGTSFQKFWILTETTANTCLKMQISLFVTSSSCTAYLCILMLKTKGATPLSLSTLRADNGSDLMTTRWQKSFQFSTSPTDFAYTHLSEKSLSIIGLQVWCTPHAPLDLQLQSDSRSFSCHANEMESPSSRKESGAWFPIKSLISGTQFVNLTALLAPCSFKKCLTVKYSQTSKSNFTTVLGAQFKGVHLQEKFAKETFAVAVQGCVCNRCDWI